MSEDLVEYLFWQCACCPDYNTCDFKPATGGKAYRCMVAEEVETREKIAEIEYKPPRWKDCEHPPLAPWNPICDTCFADAILAISEIEEPDEE